LKLLYNIKFLLYNIYIYVLCKILKKEIKVNFLKLDINFKINLFQIKITQVTAKLVGKYLKAVLKKRYSIWKGLTPVLADLRKRLLLKEINGFKVALTGRFKRAQRATFLWRKDGRFLIGTPTASIDYEVILYKTKYGVCAIKIWITTGKKMFKYYEKIFPIYKIFFFMNKKKYFILLKNELFFNKLLKKFYVKFSKFSVKYIKSILYNMLYKYLYINVFFSNLLKNKKKWKLKLKWRLILLPQFFLYKMDLENCFSANYIKIKPYINFRLFKKINIRSSYKIKNAKKKILKIKKLKYKIYLK